MATVTYSKRSEGVVNFVAGSFTGDAAAQTISCGFVPNHVIVFNETDVIRWEKLAPQAAANCIKTVAVGTMTLDATSAIVINSDGTITLSAGLAAAAKAIKFRASL